MRPINLSTLLALPALACAHSAPSPEQRPVFAEKVPVAECPTKDPVVPPGTAWDGEVRADFDVDAQGTAQSVRLDDFGGDAPAPVLRAIVDYLARCRYGSAQRNSHVAQFFDVGMHEADADIGTHEPGLIDAGMTRPVPVRCPSSRPEIPQDLRVHPVSGLVLVSYVVRVDGHVTRVHLRNREAPRPLFAIVRDWLLACQFTPSMQNGKPIAVKIIQPFNFTLR